jgi:hypothetical protein
MVCKKIGITVTKDMISRVIMIKKIWAVFILCSVSVSSHAMIRHFSNLAPYDIVNERAILERNCCFDINCMGSVSTNTKGFQVCCDDVYGDTSKHKVNVMQVWQDYQNGLAALRGADPLSEIGALDELFNTQGEAAEYAFFRPCGDLSLQSFSAALQWHGSPCWFVGLYIPIYHMKLRLNQWTPLQENTGLFEEAQYRQKVNFEELSNLSVCSWSRTGFGDTAALFWWHNRYYQYRPLLRSVMIAARGGLNLPTGKNADMKEVFSQPFGLNGGVGLIGGMDLEVDLASYAHAGIDIELIYGFGSSSIERVRVDNRQTDLLFLQKVKAFRDPGLVQQFTLYMGAHNLCRTFELTAAYQFRKQNDDTLYLYDNRFDGVVASNAQSVQEWTTHTLHLTGLWRHSRYTASLGYQWTVNGKRSIGVDAVNLSLAVAF